MDATPVGIDEPKRKIIEMLRCVEGEPEELSVISVVGFGGSGKTTLAKAVYDCPDVVSQFPCRAWVVASEHKFEGLLPALSEKLHLPDRANGDLRQLQVNIANYLSTKRYLIVFDDIMKEQWGSLEAALPKKTRSRIIVTTKIQTVAALCSYGNGYVHHMSTLDEKHSEKLLRDVLKEDSPEFKQNAASILDKCDGHPCALLTVAKYLKIRTHELSVKVYEEVCHNLGFYMETKSTFRKLQLDLMDDYTSLPNHCLKTCLLYLCVFPNGCHIKLSRLVKRWIAEGYVQQDYPRSALVVADNNFKELIDRNLIRPIEYSNNANVKTCRAHGIIHEFMLRVSTSARFITSLDDPERSAYRHLFMEKNSRGRASDVNQCSTSGSEKFRAHSLTICGSAGEAVEDFTKCELLRVLDLEECKDLKDERMNDIHELWHLKYLSLGTTISSLPKKIDKLHCLETLDVRKTKKEMTLPVEVIKLPHLAHLLGKFKLGKRNWWKKTKPEKMLPKQSNLQTLAGFVTDQEPGFPMLMEHMSKLRKVKIWCNATGEERKSLDDLSEAIKKFVQREMDTSIGVRSLSLDLGNSSGSILSSLENSFSYLSYLKLHGALSGLTLFATSLCGLIELCLSSTNNLTSDDLSNLRMLKHMESLKLVKVSLGDFTIRRRDFPKLRRLCLLQSPTLPTIQEGALPNLLTLQLLSQDLVGLSGIKIEWHKNLQEIALDSTVSDETITTWEDAARKHPKRPRVLFFKMVGPSETGSMVKYVATERPELEVTSPVVQEEEQIPLAQSISAEELSSALSQVNNADAFRASTEPTCATNNISPSCSEVAS